VPIKAGSIFRQRKSSIESWEQLELPFEWLKPPDVKKIYVAGPMRGYESFNVWAFDEAEERLLEDGWEVYSPAARDRVTFGDDFFVNAKGSEAMAEKQHGFDIRVAMAEGLQWLCLEATAIYMLPGWMASTGATAEYATARALGLRVYLADFYPQPGLGLL